jgi:hypothetical protein
MGALSGKTARPRAYTMIRHDRDGSVTYSRWMASMMTVLPLVL